MRKIAIIKMYHCDYDVGQDSYDTESIRKSIGDTGFTEVSDEDFQFIKGNVHRLNNRQENVRYDLFELLNKNEFELTVDGIKKELQLEQVRIEAEEKRRKQVKLDNEKKKKEAKENKEKMKKLLKLSKEQLDSLIGSK